MAFNSTTPSVIENKTILVLDCDIFMAQNQSLFDFTHGNFNGILYSVLFNISAMAVAILAFTALRIKAFQYGRFGLINRKGEKWISKFYGEHDYGNDESDQIYGSTVSLDTRHLKNDDKKCCSWIGLIFKISLADIREKIGNEPHQYLKFQQYLIIYIFIVLIFAAATLCVNLHGNNIENGTIFARTTISNCGPSSNVLWFHAVLAEVFIIPLFILRAIYAKRVFDPEEPVSRTLMISDIPNEKCNRNIIHDYLGKTTREHRQDFPVTEVQIAYHISKLIKYDQKRKVAEEALRVVKDEFEKTGIRPTIASGGCGKCCCCCQTCGCEKKDAIQHYQDLVEEYSGKCTKEKEKVKNFPIGIAFLTFKDERIAQRYLLFCCKRKFLSSVRHWNEYFSDIRFAPSPEDIYWENLSISGWKWWIKFLCFNGISLILLFFYTTPLIILNKLTGFEYVQNLKYTRPWLIDFALSLLIWILSAFMPNVAYFIDSKCVRYWKRSSENHSVMVKTCIFLLFMVLILPSLGIKSAKMFFEWFVTAPDLSLKWSCIFLPGHCAFFVIYVMTAAFTGTALELVRFPELILYMFKIMIARSAAEKTAIRKIAVYEFQYGSNYAWMMCIFAVTMTYSLISPLVVLFGLLYFILKHGVDRYNIYFAYKPSKIYKKTNFSSLGFMIFAIILLQLNLSYYLLSAPELNESLAIFVGMCASVNFTIIISMHEAVWGCLLCCLRKIKFLKKIADEHEQTHVPSAQSHKRYVADVLLDNELPQASGYRDQAASYGTVRSATNLIQ